MAKIETPVEGFNGHIVGVTFTDGKGETDNEGALAYFRRHGYKVSGKEPKGDKPKWPEGTPGEGWTHDQIDAFAKEHKVDLGKASTKHEKLEIIARSTNDDPLAGEPQNSDNKNETKTVNTEQAERKLESGKNDDLV